MEITTPATMMMLTDEDIKAVKSAVKICSSMIFSEVARMANSSLKDDEEVLYKGQDIRKNFRDFIYDQDEIMIKKAYQCYKDGIISDAEWQIYMQGVCINFAKDMIMRYFKNRPSEIPDFLSASLLAISMKADEYDPYQGRPTSFFQKYILQEIKAAKIDNSPTAYYKAKLQKYNELCEQIGLKDCTECSLVELAQLTGDPVKTIVNVLAQKDISVCHMSSVSSEDNDWNLDEHYEVKNMNGETSAIFDNPSEVYRKKERTDVVKETLSILSPLQRFVLMNTVYSDEPKSNREMISVLRSEEVYERFKDEYPKTKIDQKFINCVKMAGLNILKGNKSMREYCDKLALEKPFVEQMDNDVLAKIMESNPDLGKLDRNNI